MNDKASNAKDQILHVAELYLIGVLCRLDQVTIEENIRLAFAFANSHTPDTPFLLR